jgi:hypothetical protein
VAEKNWPRVAMVLEDVTFPPVPVRIIDDVSDDRQDD